MPRAREGSVIERDGKVYARIRYQTEEGKTREHWKKAKNRTHAKELLKVMIRDLTGRGPEYVAASRMTFAALADHFEMHYAHEPRYKDDRKISGYRSLDTVRSQLRVLRAFFGPRPLRSITRGVILTFRDQYHQTPVARDGGERSIASVNRMLALLRTMLNVAVAEKWIAHNPLSRSSLISLADERQRERILTRAEESRLLEACTGMRRHLRPILLIALDTGMRQGEIFKLKWGDVLLDDGVISIQAFNTKTLRRRQVAMTGRLREELRDLYEHSLKDPGSLVCGIESNVKNSFRTVRKRAGLEDVRFHDLRHTAATRLVESGIPLPQVGRVLGHSQMNTTFRYVNVDLETAKRAAEALDQFHDKPDVDLAAAAEVVN